MSTLSKEELSIEQAALASERDSSHGEGAVLGTIAVGLGSMQERLEIEAVDAFRSKNAGPQIPAAFIREEKRSIGSLVRDFWHDETSLSLVQHDGLPEDKKKDVRLIVLGICALLSLMVYVAWEGGLLTSWFERLLG